MLTQNRTESGLTLIEVMVVLVLIGLATALVLPAGFGRSVGSVALESEAQKLAGTIREARQLAITGGVSTELIIDTGNMYSISGTSTAITVDPYVTINEPSPGTSIEFSPTGGIVADVNIVLAAGTNEKTITINRQGTVNIY